MVFLPVLLLACTAPQEDLTAQVIVRHDGDGAAEGQEVVETWEIHGDELVRGEREVPLARLAAMRERILERRCSFEKLPEVPDAACLAAMGLDAEAFEDHRDEWFLAALPSFWKVEGGASELAAETKELLTWERCARDIAIWACGGGLNSIHGPRMAIELSGDPPIRILNWSELPGLLPWLVQIGDRRWFSADVGISRMARDFAPAGGSFAELLDGDAYWNLEFWSDRTFWRKRALGGALDEILCRRTYERLQGWGLADGFLRVDDVETGITGFTQPAMEFELAWRSSSPVERVHWLNPKSGTDLAHGWIDLLSAWQDAKQTVVREAWLDEWKRAGPERTLTLELVGVTIEYDWWMEEITLPAWRDAGFEGTPDWKFQLRRGRDLAATVLLSRDQPGALVEYARAGIGEHWLDAQDCRFDPHADRQTYGRVDAAGRFELRELR